jgi:hypothetical protein
VVPGEARALAEILGAFATISALATRRIEPRNSHSISLVEFPNARARRLHHADNLVARNQRNLDERQVALDGMEVRVTDAASSDPHAYLTRTGLWGGEFAGNKGIFLGRLRDLEHHCAHGRIGSLAETVRHWQGR